MAEMVLFCVVVGMMLACGAAVTAILVFTAYGYCRDIWRERNRIR